MMRDIKKFPIEIEGYTYSSLLEEDINSAAQVIAHAFARKEPLTVFLKIPEHLLFELCKTFIEQTIEDQLSLVCKNKAGHIVGAVLSRDLTTAIDLSCASVRFEPIFALLDKLIAKQFSVAQQSSLLRNQIAEMYMIGTDLKEAGKNIGRNLIRMSLFLFHQLGYQLSIAQATSPVTQSITVQLGLKPVKLLDYGDFEFNGERVFAEIAFEQYRTSKKLFAKGKAGAVLFMGDTTIGAKKCVGLSSSSIELTHLCL